MLGQHHAVQEAVVIVHEGERPLTEGEKQLVAIVVLRDKTATQNTAGPQSSAQPTIRAALRAHLQQTLPDYMVPSAFVYLNALPLTANGKIDRKALAQEPLALDRGVGDGEFVPPKTASEKILANIWAEVLDNPPIEMSSSYFQIEHRPLLPQFEQGELQPVASVALGYLPDTIAELFNGDTAQIRKAVGSGPHLSEVMTTAWGRIGIITLPYMSSQLYTEQDKLVLDIVDALRMAQQIGAKAVSLTGLIPSATEYGKAVLQAVSHRANLPTISTGHGTTSAAVVMNIRRIVEESGRDLAGEQVGFIGLGSIGLTTLRLLLHCLPHPQKLILCDVYAKHLVLQQLQQELVEDLNFQGEIELIPVKGALPPELYNATLIVGATNVPDVLDIAQVGPGTLLVDDSGPHCFSTPLAIERFQRQSDILFTEGGVLQSPKLIRSTIHFPSQVVDRLNLAEFINSAWLDPANITGCVLSSLLSASFGLPPTIGMIGVENALQHYHLLAELGFQGSQLHCEGYVLPQEAIAKFRGSFA